jgi:hypothetical protein
LDYKCTCDSGYEQTVDAVTGEKVCGNINDCGSEACGVGTCKDLVNGYECICPEGYEEIGEGPFDKTCTPKTCGVPPEVEHAATAPTHIGAAKAVFKEEIVYHCDSGYTMDGNAGGQNHFSITCQADTKFTNTKTCQPIKCGSAPSVAKATATPSEVVFNKTIKYKCEKGYTIDGTNEGDDRFSVTCQANGVYSERQECKPVTCGHPAEVANAHVESSEIVFPNKRTYECLDGFTLDSKPDGEKEFSVECKRQVSSPKSSNVSQLFVENLPSILMHCLPQLLMRGQSHIHT